jgi:hypothetical protein
LAGGGADRQWVGKITVTKEPDMETYDPHKSKTEIRQANSRRMNLRVLIFSTLGIIVLFAILYALYAWFQPAS